jgi:hypothetical protein
MPRPRDSLIPSEAQIGTVGFMGKSTSARQGAPQDRFAASTSFNSFASIRQGCALVSPHVTSARNRQYGVTQEIRMGPSLMFVGLMRPKYETFATEKRQ